MHIRTQHPCLHPGWNGARDSRCPCEKNIFQRNAELVFRHRRHGLRYCRNSPGVVGSRRGSSKSLKLRYYFPFLFLLCSCANQNYWKLDDIAAGDRAYDSSRLRYVDPGSHSPLAFELLRVGQNVEAFLTLNRNRLSPDSKDSNCVKAYFWIDGEQYQEEIPVREGGMRVRLSLEMAGRLTQALQDGKNVSILIDEYEQILESDRFSRTFSQFLGKRYNDENLFKGLIQ